ncbi:MAG: hydrogenase expression/formation protein HypE [Clostridiales bacterium]|nr:hydrogenase expression/formation protein HypE [Clostridiales bacterium]
MKITQAHGGGGKLTADLISNIFARHFANEALDQMEDAAVLTLGTPRVALTTDSFVVTPLFFPGGDIGRLAVCGTVNDLLMRGATPRYLTAGFILEEGLDTHTLEDVVISMKKTADEARVSIVAGDTKVVEGHGGLYINTAGVGEMRCSQNISAGNAHPGDVVIISGDLGLHHAAILSARMGIENTIKSDAAPLGEMVGKLLEAGLPVHTLRDITRGGLGTVLYEIAQASGVHIAMDHTVPLTNDMVAGFCDLLGLDPLFMGNEGKMALVLPEDFAKEALALLDASCYASKPRIVARVRESASPLVTLGTRGGGTRIIEPMAGEGLPRIC